MMRAAPVAPTVALFSLGDQGQHRIPPRATRASRVHPADRSGRCRTPRSSTKVLPALMSVDGRHRSLGQASGRRGPELAERAGGCSRTPIQPAQCAPHGTGGCTHDSVQESGRTGISMSRMAKAARTTMGVNATTTTATSTSRRTTLAPSPVSPSAPTRDHGRRLLSGASGAGSSLRVGGQHACTHHVRTTMDATDSQRTVSAARPARVPPPNAAVRP